MTRLTLDRRRMIAVGASALAGGCAVMPGRVARAPAAIPPAPLILSEDRLIRITVCTRPFRPAGPRIEAERIGEKVVVHNYGHGGSGWSLSWGCAAEAATLALESGAREFAVIGAGVMGLTTALRLVETGAAVTIYAKDFPLESRSARATGVWSPSSRIGLGDAVAAGFEARWEGWARNAWRAHQHYVGGVGEPVAFAPLYGLSDDSGGNRPQASRQFLHLDGRLGDMTPPWRALEPDQHDFPVARAGGGLAMTFNVASYAERLTRDFLLYGGRMVRRAFPDRSAALSLSEPTIVNCSGYGAKTLWDVADLAPVRGQINWLAPQPEARYGFFYRDVLVFSRRDGVIVQKVGDNDDFGFGDASETPDRTEMREAISTVSPLFTA